MAKEKSLTFLKESWSAYHQTHLGILLDPPEQSAQEAKNRVVDFAQKGGGIILIGGSGEIEESVFQNTVQSVVEAPTDLPIIIFPGHINQIPNTNEGISGVFNYRLIVGAEGYDFQRAFPPLAREYFTETLKQRQIPSISTLYILCGDPNASVSKVSGIVPANINQPEEQERILSIVEENLAQGELDCVFFDTGSRAKSSANPNTIKATRQLINKYAPSTLLFVGGGISEPEHATQYKSVANCLSIGTYFEKHGVTNMHQLLSAITN